MVEQPTEQQTRSGRKRMTDWVNKSYKELADFYWSEIAPERRKQGFDPNEDIPKYNWINQNGYSGLHHALKRDHETTTREFFEDVINPSSGYEYPGDDSRTHRQIDNHLEAIAQRKDYAESTIASKQSRLSRIIEIKRELYGTGDLIILGKQDTTNSFQKLMDIFDRIDEDLNSDQSKRNIQSDLISFFAHLERRGIVDYNPATSLRQEYEFKYDCSSPVHILSEEQIRKIWEATQTLEEKVIVILYIGHGLRTNEAPDLTVENFVIQTEVPYIKLEERKNQSGTIPLLVGQNYIAEKFQSVQTPGSGTDPLFPSPDMNREALTGATMRRKFKDICSRAGVTVNNKIPTPRNGRKTWYTMYIDVFENLKKVADTVSTEQGSKDPEVVLNNYYPLESELEQYRNEMKDQLKNVFTGIEEQQPEIAFPDKNVNTVPTLSDFA